jgi:hypothetical protein
MHICPHCQKLGVSSFDAMGGAGFSRGLASCRYCHNVSKRRAQPLFYLSVPVGMLLFWALIYFGKPPIAFALFWIAILMYLALLVADRCIELDKYQPPEKLPDPRAGIIAHDQGGSARAGMLLLLTLAMATAISSVRADEIPTWLQPPTSAPMYKLRTILRIDAESGLNPGFFRPTIQAPCGSGMVGGLHTLSGTNSDGHEWSYDLDSQSHLLQMNVDGSVWTAFLDQNGNVTDVRDSANHISHHIPAGPEQIKAGLAAHHDELIQVMSGCVAVKPKCIGVINTSSPAPKDCYGLPDIYSDSGFWEGYWTPQIDISAYLDTIDFETQQECLARRQNCMDSVNSWFVLAGIGCFVFVYAPPVAAACGVGAGATWGYSMQRCQAISC